MRRDVSTSEKSGLHPRNRHRGRYDFPVLVAASPDLGRFVAKNAHGDESIDFANPNAVKALNRALLKQFYGIVDWDIPEDYLCPPIPGRADYLHYLADLLAFRNNQQIPRGREVRILDIGVGANCIYPLIGYAEYGWSFLGSDTDPAALDAAARIVQTNGRLKDAVELRFQPAADHIFKGLLRGGETFDAVICNPPFHGSLEEAHETSRLKWKKLGRGAEARGSRKSGPVLNFRGHGGELWTAGGEKGFVTRMIRESVAYAKQITWFTSLISREANLPIIYGELERARVVDSRTFAMAQGQKKSRVVAWTFVPSTHPDA